MIKYAKQNEDSQISIIPDGNIPAGWIEVTEEDYRLDVQNKHSKSIAKLSLTAADVERAIYKAKGMDFEDILELVKSNPDIDLKALRIELKANNFYRGNPYIDAIGTILGLTSKQLDEFFETNDYKKLESSEVVDD